LFLAKLHSAKITGVAWHDKQLRRDSGSELDLQDAFNITDDPSPFKELFFTLRVDRLAIRYHKEDEQVFRGEERLDNLRVIGGQQVDTRAMSEFDVRATRLGVDIDLVRYPFLRAGINFDFQWEPLHFQRMYWNQFANIMPPDATGNVLAYPPAQIATFQGAGPWNIGLHATAIPARVRDVPVTIQGRVRFPMPFVSRLSFLNRKHEAQITDVEVSVAMRPSVWDLSLYGYSTFSVAVETGYRWERLEIDTAMSSLMWMIVNLPSTTTTLTEDLSDVKLKATWSGAFIQITVVY